MERSRGGTAHPLATPTSSARAIDKRPRAGAPGLATVSPSLQTSLRHRHVGRAPVLTPGDAVGLQRSVGNRAVGALMAVQRCGPTPCDCPPEERAEAEAATAGAVGTVQRAAAPPQASAPTEGLQNPLLAEDQRLQAVARDKDRIRPGDRDGSVIRLQQAFLRTGVDVGPTGADGVYGSHTGDAAIRFKKRESLTPSHFNDVGPKTVRRLDELLPKAPQQCPAIPIADPPSVTADTADTAEAAATPTTAAAPPAKAAPPPPQATAARHGFADRIGDDPTPSPVPACPAIPTLPPPAPVPADPTVKCGERPPPEEVAQIPFDLHNPYLEDKVIPTLADQVAGCYEARSTEESQRTQGKTPVIAKADKLAAFGPDATRSMQAALAMQLRLQGVGGIQGKLKGTLDEFREKTKKEILKKGATDPDAELEAKMRVRRAEQRTSLLGMRQQVGRLWAIGRREHLDFDFPPEGTRLKGDPHSKPKMTPRDELALWEKFWKAGNGNPLTPEEKAQAIAVAQAKAKTPLTPDQEAAAVVARAKSKATQLTETEEQATVAALLAAKREKTKDPTAELKPAEKAQGLAAAQQKKAGSTQTNAALLFPIPAAVRAAGSLGVQPRTVKFIEELINVRDKTFKADNYPGHDTNGASDVGHSIDLTPDGVTPDGRGFYPTDKVIDLLGHVNTAASRTVDDWHALYDDYAAARAASERFGNGKMKVTFQGATSECTKEAIEKANATKNRNSRCFGLDPDKDAGMGAHLNWHGPLNLHLHIDLFFSEEAANPATGERTAAEDAIDAVDFDHAEV